MLHAQAPFRSLGAALCTLLLLTGCSAGGGAKPEKGAPAVDAVAPAPVQVEVVAHRGGYPENTLAAFKQALGHPDVGAIELDVQVSKDGELFIMHDKTVDRTTNGKGAVADLTAAQLRALKTPREGAAEPVPLLDEALALVAATPAKRALVEIK
jgi:glycerophosphoryl diester phosphodiesterase